MFLQLLEEARALQGSGDAEGALVAYRRLLSLHPASRDGWLEYGNILSSKNQRGAASEAYAKALTLDPDHLPTLSRSAKNFLNTGQLAEAESILGRLIALTPHEVEARLDMARCQWRRGNLCEAAAVLRPAVDLEPKNFLLTSFLVDIYIREGNWPKLQEEMLRRAAEDYAGAELNWEVCGVNLLFGALPEAWDQHASRWQHKGLTNPRRLFPQPQWDGGSFAGKTLLLHFEQGFGDTLMFIRYAPMVKQLGGTVLVLVQRALVDVVATCPGIDAVFSDGDPLPSFDLHFPLLDLPMVFRTDLATVPAAIPYLGIPKLVPNRVAIQDLLAHAKDRTRIGVSWAGSLIHKRNAQRSISPDRLRPLGALPEVAWYALQLDAQELPPLPGIENLAPLLSNFSDTAYALRGLDLLITVDTAIAHLAGALGVPTLLLISYIPDWRWLMGREDTPWYPSMHLYRQTRAEDWDSVIHHVVSDLARDS